MNMQKRSMEPYSLNQIKFQNFQLAETNPLRPMSPYAVSKVYGDHLMRNYYHSYGLNTIVSRAFNHEGAGRGLMFVTSVVTNQIMKLKFGEIDQDNHWKFKCIQRLVPCKRYCQRIYDTRRKW